MIKETSVLVHECLIMRRCAELIAEKLAKTDEELDKIKILNEAQKQARIEFPFNGDV